MVKLIIYGEAVTLTEQQLEQLADNELKAKRVLQQGDYYMDVFVDGARQIAVQHGSHELIAKLLDVVLLKLPNFVE